MRAYEVIYMSKNITNYNSDGSIITKQFLKNNGYRRLYAKKHCKNCHTYTVYGKPVQIKTLAQDKTPTDETFHNIKYTI